MVRPIVKIANISIQNFKNVKFGKIDTGITNIKDSNLIGLYGQNGSGKTALIDALSLLKFVLCGQTIPEDYCNYINIDSESASFIYDFLIQLSDGRNVQVNYSFSIKKEKVTKTNNLLLKTHDGLFIRTKDNLLVSASNKVSTFRINVFNEVINYQVKVDEEWEKRRSLISTTDSEIFSPKNRYDMLIGKNEIDRSDLILAKRICLSESRSFVFSAELLGKIRDNNDNVHEDPYKDLLLSIIDSLIIFGNQELFIIDTSNHALISLNALPMSFRYDSNNRIDQGSIALPLDNSVVISEKNISIANNVISSLNTVLKAIIPDLTISIRVLNSELMKDGENGKTVELISNKNSKTIPLKYESEGIKKIISILQLLIVVYNQSSITVAIDELDSGIFEYLLGELLQIIAEKGKGQLIFTSHNLRPLELLNKKMLYFTTTNPMNRYVKMMYLKPNNNQRDYYYRSIVLGGQKEELYQPTDNFAISMAFRKAGKNGQ